MRFQPLVKWIGSKRGQSEEILKYFPENIDTYYEPFCGGCSVAYQLLSSDTHFVNKVVCSDINGDLIDLWKTLQTDSDGIYKQYERMWYEMNKLPNEIAKKEFYEIIRDKFNKKRSPYLFFFLMRTCTNGIPRYNRFGEFNNTFHLSRCGIKPSRIKVDIDKWVNLIADENVIFKKCDYNEILDDAVSGDFVYLDPPCELTRSSGRYFGRINHMDLFGKLRMLNEQDVKWALSWDGNINTPDYVVVPDDCYDNKVSIKGYNGGYRVTRLKMNDDGCYESLYLN